MCPLKMCFHLQNTSVPSNSLTLSFCHPYALYVSVYLLVYIYFHPRPWGEPRNDVSWLLNSFLYRKDPALIECYYPNRQSTVCSSVDCQSLELFREDLNVKERLISWPISWISLRKFNYQNTRRKLMKSNDKSRMWWHTSFIPALRSQR